MVKVAQDETNTSERERVPRRRLRPHAPRPRCACPRRLGPPGRIPRPRAFPRSRTPRPGVLRGALKSPVPRAASLFACAGLLPALPAGMPPAAVRTPTPALCFEAKPPRPARPARLFKATEPPHACPRLAISTSSAEPPWTLPGRAPVLARPFDRLAFPTPCLRPIGAQSIVHCPAPPFTSPEY
jgi:hypothetical protein